ncbi:hypothetical protein CDL12_15305 [Handroanthus impetiginosus]|uniref:Uncharacterized protein n=1 Tax=Handroanthus impetiginosus TaxID=429701 RepID=A0A2G9H3I6_9LAMI|nr:hypothetical protein CDL12_15305 [Handroanthus impetiginosus]
MANLLLRTLCRVSSRFNHGLSSRQIFREKEPLFTLLRLSSQLYRDPQISCQGIWLWKTRNFSHGSVSSVISLQRNPNFEKHEIEPPEKEKLKTEKRLKLERKREKQKRKAANSREKEAKVC